MTPAPTGRTGDGYPGRGVPPRPDRPQGPPRGREVPVPGPRRTRARDPRRSRGRLGRLLGPPGPAVPPSAAGRRTPQTWATTRPPATAVRRGPREPRIRATAGSATAAGIHQQTRAISSTRSYQQHGRQPATGSRRRAGSSPATAQQAPSYQQSPSFQRADRAAQDMRSADETHVPRGTRRRIPQNPEDLRPAGGPARGRAGPVAREYTPGPTEDEFPVGCHDGYGDEDDAHEDEFARARASGAAAGHRRAGEPPQGPADPGPAPAAEDHPPQPRRPPRRLRLPVPATRSTGR